MLGTAVITTNLSTYKYIKLQNTMFIFPIICGMQYKPLLCFRALFCGQVY